MSTRLSFVRKVLDNFTNFNGYDKLVLGKMTIVDVSDGRVTCELPVEQIHLNRLGTAHGGYLATLVDAVSSLAVASKGLYATGVSTDLNITFISAAKEGDIIIVDSECVKLGRSLAYTVVDLKNKKNNKLIGQGRHTKFVSIAHKDPRNILDINEGKPKASL